MYYLQIFFTAASYDYWFSGLCTRYSKCHNASRYVVVTGKFFITQIGAPYKARIIALIDCFLQRR